ncbi:MAG: hypothetical protein GY754_27135, partial [bacterium]|nr:hypothetical protein [bacterium]
NIFEDIDIDFDTYFSLHLETDSVFEPAEFTFSKFHGRSIDTFLSRIVYSVLSSNRGVIKDYTLRPWRKLNEARKLATEGFTVSPMASPEEPVFKSLRQLEDSVRDFRNTLLFSGKIKNWNNKKRVARCRKLLKQEARRINWEQFYSCSKSALKKYEVNLSIVPECRPMIEAIANINVDRNCTRIHYRELPGQDPLNRKIYTPLELTVIPQKGAESLFTDDGEYRFDDKRQVEELPPEIKPGQTIDYTGKLYSGECFKKKSIKYCEAYPKRDQVVATNFYPHSFKKANWFLRALFFWKDLPKQVIYRGSYEVVGYTKRMLPNFTLTDKALKLAELDLKEFYKKYGTHYVSQVKHRRGFVYYFIVNTTGDDDDEYIELKPYGVSKYIELGIPGAQGGQGVPGMDQGGGCLFGLFGSSSKVENPLFEPKTVKEFFNNREKLINLYQNDKKAVPVSLSLEPWSEYLKEKGILRPHQLDLK